MNARLLAFAGLPLRRHWLESSRPPEDTPKSSREIFPTANHLTLPNGKRNLRNGSWRPPISLLTSQMRRRPYFWYPGVPPPPKHFLRNRGRPGVPAGEGLAGKMFLLGARFCRPRIIDEIHF